MAQRLRIQKLVNEVAALGTMSAQAASSVAITGGSITGITDLAVADGGTGASTAANARTNLGAAASGANSDITSLTGITGTFGYATGAGGTVTQGTSKSTGVEINKICGQITTHNAALGSGNEVSFVVTNSTVGATDVVVICIASGATADAYNVQVDAVSAGSFRVALGNMTGGSLSEALVLNFVVIKGVAA